MKKNKWKGYFAVAVCTYAGALLLWADPSQATPETQVTPQVVTNKQTSMETSHPKGQIMHCTAFSSECKTSWCLQNVNKPRGQQVAVNAKYGHPKQIYIAAFDKTYTVIGTTDQNTDVDIWFASEHDAAMQFGSKQLLVNLIY